MEYNTIINAKLHVIKDVMPLDLGTIFQGTEFIARRALNEQRAIIIIDTKVAWIPRQRTYGSMKVLAFLAGDTLRVQ